MIIRLKFHPYWLLLWMLSMLPAATFAGQNAVATPVFGYGSVQWTVTGSFEEVQLSVNGPGGSFQETSSGGSVSFSLSQIEGGAADGNYTYQLKGIPYGMGQLIEQIDQAEAAGDDATMEQLTAELDRDYQPVVQSGSFNVADGVIQTGGDGAE